MAAKHIHVYLEHKAKDADYPEQTSPEGRSAYQKYLAAVRNAKTDLQQAQADYERALQDARKDYDSVMGPGKSRTL